MSTSCVFLAKAMIVGWEGDVVGFRFLPGCRVVGVDREGVEEVMAAREHRLRRVRVLCRRCGGEVRHLGCFCVRRRRALYGILSEWMYERINRLVGRGARRCWIASRNALISWWMDIVLVISGRRLCVEERIVSI